MWPSPFAESKRILPPTPLDDGEHVAVRQGVAEIPIAVSCKG